MTGLNGYGQIEKPMADPDSTTHQPQRTAASASLRELVALLQTSNRLGLHRRYVLERIDGELVFRQPEVDAIFDDAIEEVFNDRPPGPPHHQTAVETRSRPRCWLCYTGPNQEAKADEKNLCF